MCVWGGGGGGGGVVVIIFHLSARGVGHVLIVQIKSLKKILARFARSVFINETLNRPINFSVCKSYSVLVVLLLQL